MPIPLPPPDPPRHPLHGKTLAASLAGLVAHGGRHGLAQRRPLRCLDNAPRIGSRLKRLRKTPGPRRQVAGLSLFMRRALRRHAPRRAAP